MVFFNFVYPAGYNPEISFSSLNQEREFQNQSGKICG
jgi:hypothetical protein